jgi:hypothetical protein
MMVTLRSGQRLGRLNVVSNSASAMLDMPSVMVIAVCRSPRPAGPAT